LCSGLPLSWLAEKGPALQKIEVIVRLLLTMTAVLAVIALAGCAATKQEVSDNLGNRFVGKNVDSLVSEFGPPASTFRMNSGEIAYVWQLSGITYIDTDKGSGTAKTNYCKVNGISSPAGIVTKLTTEVLNYP
jgi:hypothetical protein